jgi:hypothetical protein
MTDDSREYLFYAEFNDGYSFRNLVEYLKSTNTTGNFIFTNKGITYSQNNSSNTLLNCFEIRGYDLTAYIFNSELDFIDVGINLSNLRSITKSVGKKDSLRLYMIKNNPHLHISINSPNTKELNRNNISVIRPQKLEILDFDLDVFNREECNPNCTAPSIDFNKMCTAMYAIGCNHVAIYSGETSIVFKGMFDGEIVGRMDRFGINKPKNSNSIPVPNLTDIPSSTKNLISTSDDFAPPRIVILPEDYEYSIRVSTALLKSLGKLNNLSPNGTIKMYMEYERPFKMIADVGAYGKLTIFLRDISCNDESK